MKYCTEGGNHHTYDETNTCFDCGAAMISIGISTYISSNYPSKAEFARSQGITPQLLTKWINKNFIVVGTTIYSPRREVISECK